MDGAMAEALYQPLSARAGGYASHTFRWIPAKPGVYGIHLALWKGIDSPEAYSPSVFRPVQVLDPRRPAPGRGEIKEARNPLPARMTVEILSRLRLGRGARTPAARATALNGGGTAGDGSLIPPLGPRRFRRAGRIRPAPPRQGILLQREPAARCTPPSPAPLPKPAGWHPPIILLPRHP